MVKVMNKEQLEVIVNGAAHGPVANRLLGMDMSVNALKPWIGSDGRSYMTVMNGGKPVAVPLLNTTATLRKDEWKQLDDAVVLGAQQRLVGVADLYSRNLVYRIGNGLGKTVLEYEDISNMTDAELTMDAVTPSQRDRIEYELKYLPLPIIHKDFSFNIRTLNASRTTGQPLDVTAAMQASRMVSEKVENIYFNGASSYAYGGGTLYGLVDHPQNNDVTLSAHWDASGTTGEDILDDIREMKQASIDAKHYGPWMVYIPTAYETVLDDDFKSNSDKTIRQRILEIEGIQGIKVADKMPANTVVLVQMTPDTVRMVEGMAITTVEWQEQGGLKLNYKVMTIMVPQIRADQEGNCGVVVLS